MTTVERTAYPRFKRTLTEQELTDVYTLSDEERRFINGIATTPQMQLNLALLLKSCQRLAYFPNLTRVPSRIVTYLRQQLTVPPDVIPEYDWDRTLYRHRQQVRDYLQLRPYREGGEAVATAAMQQAIQTMMYPADLINVAIEKLIRQSILLPAFSTLNRMALSIRAETHQQYYEAVVQQIIPEDRDRLDQMLRLADDHDLTHFTALKQPTGRLSRKTIDATIERIRQLDPLQEMTRVLSVLPVAKIGMFGAEAQALEAGDLLDTSPPRRYTLLLCFLSETQTRLRDDLAELLVKRMAKVYTAAKDHLEKVRQAQQTLREQFIDRFAEVVQITYHTDDDQLLAKRIRRLVAEAGGYEQLQQDYEEMMAYRQNNAFPLVWQHFRSHRRVLFDLVDTLDIGSTTQEQHLVKALTFVQANRYRRRLLLAPEIDISFLPQQWRQLIVRHQDGQVWHHRQHLEAAIFMTVAGELKTGDLYVANSYSYADYRQQLLSWELCQPYVSAYCEALGIPSNPNGFVDGLRQLLRTAIAVFDESIPDNESLTLHSDGSLTLKRLTKQPKPPGLDLIERQLRQRMPERQILDILSRLRFWFPFTQYFGPRSGSQPKMADPDARYLLTLFGYGCNLGAKQAAQHTRLPVTARVLRRINQQHMSLEQLDLAIRDTINHYRRFDLPRFWGTGRAAAADGIQFDLYRNNLLAERHVRYGGYGGIAYHHVSDTYIALFSHFINVGVWEAVYIFDGLLKNQSDIQPDTLHADTHGQSEPVFGLAYLLGIRLMPRIRNWKRLTLYRAASTDTYQHVDALFTDTIDWEIIRTHWQDLMQVVISIQQGHVLPSMLLRKLRHDSRKNRLYRAFRELGRVTRTLFLLNYLSDGALRRRITAVTNQVESYNGFSDWLFFGDDGKIKHNNPLEFERRIKYNDLIANLVMLHNVMEMTRILTDLRREGYPVNRETVSRLSPYLTEHIRRFGEYIIDLDQDVEPPLFEFKTSDSGEE